MIITRTPFRISFAGGGSDLKEYYLNYGGAVLSVAIDKYVYLSMHPYFHEEKFFLKYSQSEHVDCVENIRHRIIRAIFSDYGIQGVDFNSSADVPSGTGLGSSSSFTVGLTNLCNAYTSRYMSKEDIAAYACEIEIGRLHEPIGKQDQYAAAIGGMNLISFNPDDTVSMEKILLPKHKQRCLQENLLMFYLGTTRKAASILTEQKQNTIKDVSKIENCHRMVQLAFDLREELVCRQNLDALGEILHTGWMYKRELASAITNEKIDHYYSLARSNGALGGKLLGAGGGGFLLFYVQPENQARLRQALQDLTEFQFGFDHTGTTVIYYNN